MSDENNTVHSIDIQLRPIDRKRLDGLQDRTETALSSDNIWYVHTVLAQCFLPYTDQKDTRDWMRHNGSYGIILTAGAISNPRNPKVPMPVGLPFGAKPRLFQSYVCTQAIKHQSRIIAIEHSMTAMMKELGFSITGGNKGTINSFKEQITRFAACKFTIISPGARGTVRHIHAEPFEYFDVWFPPDPDQETLWPSEIVLTERYYSTLKEHAVPFDFRALKAIRNKPRAQDIYLWMTQRLCRIPRNKPLLMRWHDLYEMFSGLSTAKEFKRNFPADLATARASYPDARIEEHKEGYLFCASLPPVPKTKFLVK
jgi:hypothetical protein